MAVTTPTLDRSFKAPDFRLLSTEGQWLTRDDIKCAQGLLVMFICNHCPYVQAILTRLVQDAKAVQALGVGVVAICSNDPVAYPEDDFGPMQELARAHGFTFPYLHDTTQTVAKAYGAVCTPDFFGFNADLRLQYRGRLDSSGRQAGPADAPRELVMALQHMVATGLGPENQTHSIGCSIKWRNTED